MPLGKSGDIMNFWKDKKVFITGHTGFKGAWLSMVLLNMGANIFGYSLPPSELNFLFNELSKDNSFNKIESCFGDIRDANLLFSKLNYFKPDIVFHFAAQALVKKSYDSPYETWDTNLMGTLCILESVSKTSEHTALVIATTDKVYKNDGCDVPFSEDSELGGSDPYSASKAAVELLVRSWCSSYSSLLSSKDISIVAVRAGNVIGGGDYAPFRLVPDIIRAFSTNSELIVRNHLSIRPWQHVLDPLYGYMRAAEDSYTGNISPYSVFNFGPSPDNIQSVEALLDQSQKYLDIEWFPATTSQKFVESEVLLLDSTYAYRTLQWSPKLNFEQSVYRTINWYLSNISGLSAFDCCLADISTTPYS